MGEFVLETQVMPAECKSLEEARAEIDRLDKAILQLLAKRYQYVTESARFKSKEDSVHQPARFNHVIQDRREWAQELGLPADVIDKLYRDLIDGFNDDALKNERIATELSLHRYAFFE